MAIHPYLGVVHDAELYSLFALARLHPALGHDFFVVSGAQDHYTVFTSLYAVVIRLLGLDRAAALLVLVTQALFFCAAWRLARQVTTAHMALLGLGLLAVLPSWYGAHMAFYQLEMFPTPRQPAEAFVLLGISFAVSAHRWIAAACLLVAVLLHPIIAGAGLLFWIMLEFAPSRPGATVVIGLVCAGLGLLAAVLPMSPLPRFDHAWLNDLTHRQAFLFPTLWSAQDWARPAPGLATLFVGSTCSSGLAARRLCLASLATVLTGLALTIIGGDVMHVATATQLQMWRWLWLSGTLSGLLLAFVVAEAWKTGLPGRTAALALVACWITTEVTVVFCAASLACLSAALLTRRSPTPAWQTWVLLLAACAMLLLATDLLAQDWYHLVERTRDAPSEGSHFATRIGQLRMLASSPPLCALLLVLVWQLACTNTGSQAALIALGVTSCVIILPYAWVTWTRMDYPSATVAQFESWRRIIPAEAEVLWPDSPPVTLWYSLHRASYFSPVQMAGIVFSRQAWETGRPRESAVMRLLPLLGGLIAGSPVRTVPAVNPPFIFGSICSARGPGFFASWRDLGASPYPVLNVPQPPNGRPEPLRLYHCGTGS